MISLTRWVDIIKDLLKSKQSKKEIREKILENCLYSPYKRDGMYQVDENKVWELVILKDIDCVNRMAELKIQSIFGIYSYNEEIEYKKMRATYPKNRGSITNFVGFRIPLVTPSTHIE